MAILRRELQKVGFDFASGRILYQQVDYISPGLLSAALSALFELLGWADKKEVGEIIEIDFDHPILDFDFDNDYGDFGMPRFVAEDKDKIYFPCEYDGLCWVDWVYKDIDKYIEYGLTPYIGQG